MARRPAEIPTGCWPALMRPEIAAGYCGEVSVDAFLRRVGDFYPEPSLKKGGIKRWLKEDLDHAIYNLTGQGPAPEDEDAAAAL